ncbi:MAG: hypothetical protein LBD53_11390 [Tannerella sp.]|jgi:hypothetical protein|nr:hypothetical protein [Tannerella sp.]
MKNFCVCFLLLFGYVALTHAQDKMVLSSNCKAKDVKILRIEDERIVYSYMDDSRTYERPKSSVAYIVYANGKRVTFDEYACTSKQTSSSARTSASSASARRITADEEVFWQDVKTTYDAQKVKNMKRLGRVTASSTVSYKDAVDKAKKKAAAIGGTIILLSSDDDSDGDETIVSGMVYRDENMAYTPRPASERTPQAAVTSANERRRRILRQMESYENDSNLQLDDDRSRTTARPSTARSDRNDDDARTSRSTSRPAQQSYEEEAPDAIYLTDGRVIKGTIEELENDEGFVTIRNTKGKVQEIYMDDIKRIAQGTGTMSAARKPSPSRSNKRPADDEYDNRRPPAAKKARIYEDDFSLTGYKGTFDAGYNLPVGGTGEQGSVEINTSHGYQINKHLFVGAGAGLHIYWARNPKMKETNSFPQYVGDSIPKAGGGGYVIKPDEKVTWMRAVDSSYMTLPIFLDVRGYLPLSNSSITPFAMLRVGYAFNLSDGFSGMGIYMNPAVGVKYNISPKIGVTMSLGYAYQNYGGVPSNGGYGYYYYKDKTGRDKKEKFEATAFGAFSLKLGVEF